MLKKLQQKFPDQIIDVRGEGLMLGIEFSSEKCAAEVKDILLRKYQILSATALQMPQVLTLTPPCVISDDSIAKLEIALTETLK